MRPSLRDFSPYSKATRRPSMSIMTRGGTASSRSFCAAFSASVSLPSISSWSRAANRSWSCRSQVKRLQAAWSSPRSSRPASSSRNSPRDNCKSEASSSAVSRSCSTTRRCSTGATSRLSSTEQSSSSSPSRSLPRLPRITLPYWWSHTFRRSVQNCSFRSKTFAQGRRAASFQNSWSSIDRPRLGLLRGSSRNLFSSLRK
mmetsp:Transcript_8688/g.20097  ORF Transcript_8688/g.20097 Transcript_8688/m.20097 type:complete len:201 (+) Transcript_8688:934-1536(+)